MTTTRKPSAKKLQTKREQILHTSSSKISVEREAEYGCVMQSFTQHAAIMNGVLLRKLKTPLTGEDVALLYIAGKLARLAAGHGEDSNVDIVGYAALHAEYKMRKAEGEISSGEHPVMDMFADFVA